VSDFFGTYEETNLKFYAGQHLENFMLFKHPHKFEAKNCIEDLPRCVANPFKVMKLWIRWEVLDIAAMLEAIEAKSELENKRHSIMTRKTNKQKDLEKLKGGKNTFKTLFQSQDAKVNTITNLTREIQGIEREIECYDVYIRTLVCQINHAAIPYFKKDKVGLYNDLINTYSQQYINNSQLISQCFAKIMELNSMINTDLIVDELPSTKLVSPVQQEGTQTQN
jgi:ABC-type antimicrobial peptide transport system permease subunit